MNITPTPRTDNIFSCPQYGKIEYALFAMELERELASMTTELLALKTEHSETEWRCLRTLGDENQKLTADLTRVTAEREAQHLINDSISLSLENVGAELTALRAELVEAKRIHGDDLRAKDWELYRQLKMGEVCRVGDSYYCEDTDKWLPVVAGRERAVADPQFPAHVLFRRYFMGRGSDALRARVAELVEDKKQGDHAAQIIVNALADSKQRNAELAEQAKEILESARYAWGAMLDPDYLKHRIAELEAAMKRALNLITEDGDSSGMEEFMGTVDEIRNALALAESPTPDHIVGVDNMVQPAPHPDTVRLPWNEGPSRGGGGTPAHPAGCGTGGPQMSAREVPPGCIEVPGIVLELPGSRQWITQAGQITNEWRQRGVWATDAEAQAVLDRIDPDGQREERP